MKRKERIAKYGEDAYAKVLVQERKRYWENREKVLDSRREWRDEYPEESSKGSRNQSRKGGKYYAHAQVYESTGLRAERRRIRGGHARKWRQFKNLIAPESQVHHEWIPDTSNYNGVALVEKNQHMHGYIDVIKVLEGKITLLSEKEIRGR